MGSFPSQPGEGSPGLISPGDPGFPTAPPLPGSPEQFTMTVTWLPAVTVTITPLWQAVVAIAATQPVVSITPVGLPGDGAVLEPPATTWLAPPGEVVLVPPAPTLVR